jgi:hypothetical protein
MHEEFERRDELEGSIGSVTVGELTAMEPEELVRLVRADTLQGIYSPESTGGLIFDREFVQFSSLQLARSLALRVDLQASLMDAEISPIPGSDQAASHRELLQHSDRLILELLQSVALFAIAERFSPAARSDAVSCLAAQLPQVAPLLSTETRAELREIVREASESERADPRLKALSDAW